MSEPDRIAATDYVSLLKAAKEHVNASVLYRRFIDGTPLENDIAVWMADFASNCLDVVEQERDEWRALAVNTRSALLALQRQVREFSEQLFALSQQWQTAREQIGVEADRLLAVGENQRSVRHDGHVNGIDACKAALDALIERNAALLPSLAEKDAK